MRIFLASFLVGVISLALSASLESTQIYSLDASNMKNVSSAALGASAHVSLERGAESTLEGTVGSTSITSFPLQIVWLKIFDDTADTGQDSQLHNHFLLSVERLFNPSAEPVPARGATRTGETAKPSKKPSVVERNQPITAYEPGASTALTAPITVPGKISEQSSGTGGGTPSVSNSTTASSSQPKKQPPKKTATTTTATPPAPTPTATLTASPASIKRGQSTTLTWSSANAASCTASNGWSGSKSTSGSKVVAPTITTTYTTNCSGATASRTITVTEPTLPPLSSLSVAPTTITSGQSSILTWASSNAASCTASGGWTGSKTTISSQSVAPTRTTIYTLTCSGAGGTSSASATVTVTQPALQPTVSLSVTPSSVTSSQSATLTWSSTNASSCTAGNGWSGSKSTSGSASVAPPQTTTYTLACSGAGGTSAPASAQVTVSAAPTPPASSTPPTTPPPANTNAYDALVLGDGPTLYLAMNAASSGNEPDRSGKGEKGTYTGTPTAATLPNGDTAAAFNGSSQYLSVPSRASLSIPTTGKLTWEAWIRPDTLAFPRASGDGYVDWMGKCSQYSPTCEWEARMYNLSTSQDRPSRLSAYAFNPGAGLGSGADWQPELSTIAAGDWLYVVAEYDLSATPSQCSSAYPGTINIWVNAIKQNFATHAPTGCMSQYRITPKAGSSPLMIGTMALDTWFKGAIGKVAIYGRLLSPTEINEHFTAMTGKKPSGFCGDRCTAVQVQ